MALNFLYSIFPTRPAEILLFRRIGYNEMGPMKLAKEMVKSALRRAGYEIRRLPSRNAAVLILLDQAVFTHANS